eukprot:11497798-Alexandrium_andersonii.AAC.1
MLEFGAAAFGDRWRARRTERKRNGCSPDQPGRCANAHNRRQGASGAGTSGTAGHAGPRRRGSQAGANSTGAAPGAPATGRAHRCLGRSAEPRRRPWSALGRRFGGRAPEDAPWGR